MGLHRAAVPTALLALLALGAAWLWSEAPQGDGPEGTFILAVEGPHGPLVAAQEVRVARGTPLTVLLEGAARNGLDVEWTGSAGPGPSCSTAYVSSIGGHAARGAAGWEYWVRSSQAAWRLPDAGAGCLELRPGDEVAWRWTDAPSAPGDAPSGAVSLHP